jgi:hypothetical protein
MEFDCFDIGITIACACACASSFTVNIAITNAYASNSGIASFIIASRLFN